MRIPYISLFSASPLFANPPTRDARPHALRWQADPVVRFRAPALLEFPAGGGAVHHLEHHHDGTAVLVTALAIGFPVSMLMLAKLTGSDLLGWVFGLVLMLEFAALPWIALFGPGRWLQRVWGRQSH